MLGSPRAKPFWSNAKDPSPQRPGEQQELLRGLKERKTLELICIHEVSIIDIRHETRIWGLVSKDPSRIPSIPYKLSHHQPHGARSAGLCWGALAPPLKERDILSRRAWRHPGAGRASRAGRAGRAGGSTSTHFDLLLGASLVKD